MFMKNHKKEYPIEKMAQCFGVSRSGYYNWVSEKKSNKKLNDSFLLEKICKIYFGSLKIYGAAKITLELSKEGIFRNEKTIARIMSENRLFSIRCKKYKVQTTIVDPDAYFSPNLLKQNFSAEKADKIWVSDITYIPTKTGMLYLCVIKDLFSRRVVGWSLADHMKTFLLNSALIMEVRARKPRAGLIFHSDRGSQYTSKSFRRLISLFKMNQSMSRTGNCYDNACAESFFSCLKTEAIYPYDVFENESSARAKIFQYIEVFFNKKRSHSYLGYKSPEEFELKKCA